MAQSYNKEGPLLQGLDYVSRELYERAIHVLKEYVLTQPNDFYAHSQLVWCFCKEDSLTDDAALFYRNFSKSSGGEAIYQYYQAERYYYKDRYADAIGIYRSLISKGARSACILHSLGMALWEENKHTDAIECFEKSLNIDHFFLPSYSALALRYYALENYDACLSLARKANNLQLEKKTDCFANSPDKFSMLENVSESVQKYREGILLLNKQDYIGALRRFLRVQELVTKNLHNIWAIIYCYYHLNRLEYARPHLHKLVAEESSEQFEVNGLLQYYGDQEKQARQSFSKAVKDSSKRYLVLYFLGITEDVLDETDSAIKRFKASIKENPRFLLPYYRLGRIYRESKQYDNALGILEQVPKGSKSYAKHYIPGGRVCIRDIEVLRAKALSNSGNFAKATERFNKLKKEYPSHGLIWSELSFCYWRKGNMQQSKRTLLKAFELDDELPSKIDDEVLICWKDLAKNFPENGALQYLMGLGLAYQEQYDEAIKTLKMSSRMSPYKAESYYHLGNLFLQIEKDSKKSLVNFKKALEARHDFGPAAKEIVSLFPEAGKIDSLLRIRNRFPKNLQLRKGILNLLIQQGKTDKAKQEADFIVKMEPSSILARLARARHYSVTGNTRMEVDELKYLVTKGEATEDNQTTYKDHAS